MQKSEITRFPRKHFSVTPSDTAKFTAPCTIYVGTGGDVAVADWNDGTVVTYKNLPSGSIIPLEVSQVRATNTNATDLVAIVTGH